MLAKFRVESIKDEGVVAISCLGVFAGFLVWFGQVAKLRGDFLFLFYSYRLQAEGLCRKVRKYITPVPHLRQGSGNPPTPGPSSDPVAIVLAGPI